MLQAQPNVVQWHVEPIAIEAGKSGKVLIKADIQNGWKVYAPNSPAGKPVSIQWQILPANFIGSGIDNAYEVHEGFDENFGKNVRYFEQTVTLESALAIPATAKVGKDYVGVEVAFMACNDRMCLPLRRIEVEGNIEVLPIKVAAIAQTPKPEATENSVSKVLETQNNATKDTISTPIKSTSAPTPPVQKAVIGLQNTSVAPNGLVEIKTFIDVPSGWKLYAPDSPAGRPFKIHLDQTALKVERYVLKDSAKTGYDQAFKAQVRYTDVPTTISAFVRVGKDFQQGMPVAGKVVYMLCNATFCVPYQQKFSLPIALNQSSNTAVVATPSPKAIPQKGLGGFILLALLSGFFALLAPCVFPMIPLTVSYFLKQESGNALKNALFFGLSIMLIFTGLGLVLAMLLGANGAQWVAANPWVNLFIGGTLLFFGVSLLGFYELRMPHQLTQFSNAQSQKGGILGILFMALTLSLVSFSCTAPFVGTLLAAAVGGDFFYPILGMLLFSLTFALPFVLLAAFPQALQKLPKSGNWMKYAMVTLGFVELAAALKFLSNADLVWKTNLLSRNLALLLSILILGLGALFWAGGLKLPHLQKPKSIWRWLGVLLFVLPAGYLATGFNDKPLSLADAYLPPVHQPTALQQPKKQGIWFTNEGQKWEQAKSDAFAKAKQSNKGVLIDFSGYTCTNCRQMEAGVLTLPKVEAQIQHLAIPLRLFTDDLTEGEAMQQFQLNSTGTVALPTYALYDEKGGLIRQWNGLANEAEFMAFLQGK